MNTLRCTWTALCLAIIGLFVTAVDAAAQPRVNDNEISFAAAFTHQQDSDNGLVTGDVSYSRYVGSPMMELGIEQDLSWVIVDDGEDPWFASTFPFFNWNFHTDEDQRFIPFLGAFVGGIYNDEEGTGIAGPQAGLKAFFDDDTFMLARYRYEWYFDEDKAAEITEDDSEGRHVLTLGIGYLWGGDGRR